MCVCVCAIHKIGNCVLLLLLLLLLLVVLLLLLLLLMLEQIVVHNRVFLHGIVPCNLAWYCLAQHLEGEMK